jgi:Flp pilus assembly pilin Flp
VSFYDNTESQLGQAMVEYALLMALVTVVAVGTLATVGSEVLALYTSISASLSGVL